MARFARDALQMMSVVVKNLEVQLGPDTGEFPVGLWNHAMLLLLSCDSLTLFA